MDMSINILIIGYGSIGKRHFHNLNTLGFHNIAFLRSGKSTLDNSAISNNKIFYDIDSALKEKPDLVFITNPTSLHMVTALKIAEAGCHFFIEKPISNTLKDCNQLLKLVKEKNLITMVGFQFRFHPLLIELRSMIDKGELGKVYNATASYGEYLPNWHPWEDYKKSYSARKDLGGGVILTLIHPMDYLYWIFGDVKNVQALCEKINIINTDVPDDVAEIILYFKSGLIAHIHLDYIQRPASHTLKVYGDSAITKIDFIKGIMEHTFIDGSIDKKELNSSFDRNKMYLDEIQHFISSVNKNKQSRIPLQTGIDVLKFSLDAKISALG